MMNTAEMIAVSKPKSGSFSPMFAESKRSYPPRILGAIWLGMVSICLMFWAFILHAIYFTL